MRIQDFIHQLFGYPDAHQRFTHVVDSTGIALIADENLLEQAERGKASPLMMHQLVQLKMLAEEGLAEEIGNGFLIETVMAVQLDQIVVSSWAYRPFSGASTAFVLMGWLNKKAFQSS